MSAISSTHSDFESQRFRLAALFHLRTFYTTIPALPLCLAGFVPSVDDEEQCIIWCPWCNLKLKDLQDVHNPLAWHQVLSKSCPFLTNNAQVDLKDLAINSPTNSAPISSFHSMVSPRYGASIDAENLNDNVHESQQNIPITLTNNTIVNRSDEIDIASAAAEELLQLYSIQVHPRNILPPKALEIISKPSKQCSSTVSNFTYERHRRLTFNNWPKKDTVSPKALAASGFVYLHETEDTVECIFCKAHIGNWTADMVPDVVHMKKSKHCPLMKGDQSVKNKPDLLADVFEDDPTGLPSNRSDLGIIIDPTKYPVFAVESRRKATFLTWPSANHKLASEMIEHALFYTGQADVVCCFSCGTEMSGWTSTDNIWRRHARQAAHCQLVIQEKGADWVAAIIEEHGRYQAEEREPAIITVTTRMLRPRMDNLATQQVLKLQNPSYPRDEVRSCLIQNIKYGRPDYMNRKDIVTAILKRREDRRQQEMVERSTSSDPAPPVVVSPPRIPRERATTIQDEETTSVQPPMIQENEHHNAAATITPATSNNAAAMEVEPTAANIQRPTSPLPATNPMDLARIMKAQLTCKICMDAPVGIAFLPCGHMVCCPSCSPAMVQCPLCRQDVRGTVRVYLDKL